MSDKYPRRFGKYHLLGPLAQGGMGALYLAVTGDRGLERLIVIKTVLPHLADSEYVARFRDEAKVVVKLSHGNLIPVFDAGQVGGELFLAMDYVEGKDLRAVWNRCAKKAVAFPVDVACCIVKELCRGLDYAHSFGDLQLVHRDVSPPNVLLSFAGEVKLTDFGLAASTLKLEKTAPGIVYGKVAYMSPEQARGEPLDGRSDIYAAGIILWELLTGRQLFPPTKEQPSDLLARSRDPMVDVPSRRAPRVPRDLDLICLKALAPRREDRFASGEEMRIALAGWLAKESPATDSARLSSFVTDLFREDLEADRTHRQALIDKARERARTLPPSDELRRALDLPRTDDGRTVGRRATDRVEPSGPSRRIAGRRAMDRDREFLAVDVPRVGPTGKTVVRRAESQGGLATAQPEPEFGDPEIDPADSANVLGQVLDGRYHILDLIGEGGMGRVYLAEHVEIGKRVAIKILHSVYGRMPDLVERFRREARAASKIGHPHIVDVTDSGTTADGSVYFVMEYLEGVELASVIDREGALDVARALHVTTQICRALSAAHAAGIIHRDLKPENVYLTVREGTSDFVKVLDFGIAKSSELEATRSARLTHPGMAMGTPEYMAPEQAAGRPADARTDVYAVGAILYEMMTGVPPYEGENFMEILTKKATIDPVPPRELRPELSPAIDEIIMRALARDAHKRPPSMEALEYELTKCLSGRGPAVAKILGMPADAASGETYRDGAELTPQPRRRSNRMASVRPDDVGGAAEGSLPVSPSASAAVARGGAGKVFAAISWTALVLLLTFGIAVLVLVAAGERSGRQRQQALAAAGAAPGGAPAPGGQVAVAPATPPQLEQPQPGPSATPASSEKPTGELPAGVPPAQPDPEQAPAPVAETPQREKPPAAPQRERPSRGDNDRARRQSPGEMPAAPGPPATRAEAQALLDAARSHEAKLEWAKARTLYERVVAGRFARAAGMLGLAKVSFETNDTDAAITYARRALGEGSGDSARLMLGHAYFKKKRYDLAISYYDTVLEHNPRNLEALQSVKAARKLQAEGQ